MSIDQTDWTVSQILISTISESPLSISVIQNALLQCFILIFISHPATIWRQAVRTAAGAKVTTTPLPRLAEPLAFVMDPSTKDITGVLPVASSGVFSNKGDCHGDLIPVLWKVPLPVLEPTASRIF